MTKSIKLIFVSVLMILAILMIQTAAFAATTANATIFQKLKAEFSKKQMDEKLFKQAIITLKPAGFQTVETYSINDIDKEKIPEIAVAYKKASAAKKTSTEKFVIFMWNGGLTKYIESYSKTMTNVTANIIAAASSTDAV